MSFIHTSRYNIPNDKVKRQIRVAVISDVHFAYNVSDKKLYEVAHHIDYLVPEYIVIAGDLIDSVNMMSYDNEKRRLLDWLSSLSNNIAPVIVSLGAHDYYAKDKNLECGWRYCWLEDFMLELKCLNKNVHLVNDSSWEDKDITFAGFTLPFEVTHPTVELPSKGILYKDSNPEDKEALLRYLNKDNIKNLITNLSSEKLNIAMVHSPESLTDARVKKVLDGFDLKVSGHMHNGLIPPYVWWMFPEGYGLGSPKMKFFPNNARGSLKAVTDEKLLVNGPIITFSECNKPLDLANVFYPMCVSIADYSPEIEVASVEHAYGRSRKLER